MVCSLGLLAEDTDACCPRLPQMVCFHWVCIWHQ